ncbi:DUF1830 domain-containing protein [Acaryochloris thomasi]|nr:DUF1830 domain-containing protein [Acaryochloris thomasi]
MKQATKTVCRYINHTRQFQIVRIANVSDTFFERTVLPGHQVVFEADFDAELEVHTYEIATAILTARISCDRLASI